MLTSFIETPLGSMQVVADDNHLYGLCFGHDLVFHQPNCVVIAKLQGQLDLYFSGKLKVFELPLKWPSATEFQKKVWTALQDIPFSHTCSYKQIAEKIQQPLAVRAVANAIAKNPIQIINPCHRVICSNGDIGGYQAGHAKKDWLLMHEQHYP